MKRTEIDFSMIPKSDHPISTDIDTIVLWKFYEKKLGAANLQAIIDVKNLSHLLDKLQITLVPNSVVDKIKKYYNIPSYEEPIKMYYTALYREKIGYDDIKIDVTDLEMIDEEKKKSTEKSCKIVSGFGFAEKKLEDDIWEEVNTWNIEQTLEKIDAFFKAGFEDYKKTGSFSNRYLIRLFYQHFFTLNVISSLPDKKIEEWVFNTFNRVEQFYAKKLTKPIKNQVDNESNLKIILSSSSSFDSSCSSYTTVDDEGYCSPVIISCSSNMDFLDNDEQPVVDDDNTIIISHVHLPSDQHARAKDIKNGIKLNNSLLKYKSIFKIIGKKINKLVNTNAIYIDDV